MGSGNQVGVNGECNTYAGRLVQACRSRPTSARRTTSGRRPPATTSCRDPPDYIGVWVRTTLRRKTGTFFDDMTITKVSIYRIQPDIDG